MPSSSRMEKICANLFILIVTIFFMFIFCEILMKLFFFHPSYNLRSPGMLNGHGGELKVELIPNNLYKIQPNKKLGINKYGFRDHDFSIQKHGLKRIVFLGDSFVMGLNVKSEETMPKMLEKQLKNYEVDNMGVFGFGPDQELNVFEESGFKLKPDMVIEGFCAMNDSGDILNNAIYTIWPHDKLEVTRTNMVKSMVFSSAFSIVNQINFLKNRDYILSILDPLLFDDGYDLTWIKNGDLKDSKFKFSLMEAIFQRMNDEISSRKINFLAIIIPSYNNICNDTFFKENHVDPTLYFTNESVYQHILEVERIPYINLAPYFMQLEKQQRCNLYDSGNGHFSPLGNFYASKIIALYMNEHGLIEK